MVAAPLPKPAHFVVSGDEETQGPNADYRVAASPARGPLVIQWKRAGASGADVIGILVLGGVAVFPWYSNLSRELAFVCDLVFVPIILALGLRALKESLNHTIVTLDDEHLRCDRRPIRLFESSAVFDARRVKDVWVDEVMGEVATTEGYERQALRYDVRVRYESGDAARTPLVRMAHWEEDEARFLVETINRRLGRPD